MQLGLSHVVFDVLGPGKGNRKLPDSDVLGCATEGVIVDGPDGSSREIVAPVFSMKEDPVIRGVFQMGRVRRGRGDRGWQGRRLEAEFVVRLEDETLEIFVVPPASNMAFVQKARHVEVVLLPCILLFISPKETVNDANYHLGRVVGRRANVVVEVHSLLEGFGQKLAVFNPDCEVQKVNRLRGAAEIPLQQSKVVCLFHKLGMADAPGIANPDSKTVVDETAEKE